MGGIDLISIGSSATPNELTAGELTAVQALADGTIDGPIMLAGVGEEMIVNGTFAAGTTGWTFGNNWLISGTSYAYHTAGGIAPLQQTHASVIGTTYMVLFTVANRTAGSVYFRVGGVDSPIVSTNRTVIGFVTATSANTPVYFWPTTDFDGRIDNVSVRAVEISSIDCLTVTNHFKASSTFGFGVSPVARQAHIADPTGGAVVDAEARATLAEILVRLETYGFNLTS